MNKSARLGGTVPYEYPSMADLFIILEGQAPQGTGPPQLGERSGRVGWVICVDTYELRLTNTRARSYIRTTVFLVDHRPEIKAGQRATGQTTKRVTEVQLKLRNPRL